MKKCFAALLLVLGSAAFCTVFADGNLPGDGEKDARITLSIRKGLDFDFVNCPAGSFTMGVIGDMGEQSSMREHKVVLTHPFWMMTKKVSWKQWKTCGGKVHFGYPKSVSTDDIPIFRVSYDEIRKFSETMTKRFKAKIPKGYVLRLPTEAEWEYALNANCSDSSNPYVSFRDEKINADQIMPSESDVMKMFPVEDVDGIAHVKSLGLFKYLAKGGTKAPNSWGIYDMLGNGGEMTLDLVCLGKRDYYEKAQLNGKLVYKEEETDPFKFDPWGDVCIARGTSGNMQTHSGDWHGKDAVPISQTKYVQRGFRLVIGVDYVGEWKAKNSAKAKPGKGSKAKNGGK